jgi:hypothetical protein
MRPESKHCEFCLIFTRLNHGDADYLVFKRAIFR